MYYGAANRDPLAFDEPERFDITRMPNDHLAFGGGGPHFCLGSHVARVEIDAMFRQLLSRLPDLQKIGDTEWQQSSFVSGPSTSECVAAASEPAFSGAAEATRSRPQRPRWDTMAQWICT
jgi:cytochrome P450